MMAHVNFVTGCYRFYKQRQIEDVLRAVIAGDEHFGMIVADSFGGTDDGGPLLTFDIHFYVGDLFSGEEIVHA